jgi:hypothetical protein
VAEPGEDGGDEGGEDEEEASSLVLRTPTPPGCCSLCLSRNINVHHSKGNLEHALERETDTPLSLSLSLSLSASTVDACRAPSRPERE